MVLVWLPWLCCIAGLAALESLRALVVFASGGPTGSRLRRADLAALETTTATDGGGLAAMALMHCRPPAVLPEAVVLAALAGNNARCWTADFLSRLRGTFTALSLLQIPTIAAISSLALGGGLELALAAHFRVLSSNAVVALPETRLGIIPGAGGTARLPAIIGLPRARDLILTGRRVSAAEAYFLGLADRLVEVEQQQQEKGGGEEEEAAAKKMLQVARKSALAEAVRLAQEICEGGPVAVRAALGRGGGEDSIQVK
ncbi:Crotonase, core [Moelleriella libera RCEF 2490]|uniref:Crotonase, core n=1 Tax=Moelleriella libera RCEF 2490 TaxID=1081109 RepID=A0A167ZCY9_9HYPO|nr:Crotonase, core [Moelleriella libera RCEF 2490]